MECYRFDTTGYVTSHQAHLTDAPMPVLAGSLTYQPRAVTRSSIVRDLSPRSVTVTMPHTPDDVSWRPGDSTRCTIYRCVGFEVGDATIAVDELRVLYSGDVIAATYDGMSVTYEVASSRRHLGGVVGGGVVQRNCRWALFGEGCGRVASDYAQVGVVAAVIGEREISSSVFASPPDPGYWRGGKVVVGDQLFAIAEYIPVSTSVQVLGVLPEGTTMGTPIEAWPGCDKTLATCTSRYANQSRYGGFVAIPGPRRFG